MLKRLDAPLDDRVPAKRPILVNDLLTMRMGMRAILVPFLGSDSNRKLVASGQEAADSWLALRSCVYVKKTPFCSRPSTEIRFREGFGASDSKRKPSCSADHLTVAPVLRNEPIKRCESF